MRNTQSNAKENALVVPSEDVVISPPTPKPASRIMTAIRKPGAYISETFQNIKGRDLETLVEEFSSDVSLVLGGLSDDQERLGHECERLSQENDRLRQQLGALEKRMKDLEKKSDARPEREGLVRRLTWLAAVVFGGIAIVSIIKFLMN